MCKIVVSNTTPILSLLKISKIELMKDVFKKIIVPHSVFEEIEAGKDKDYYIDLSKLNWVDIKNLRNYNNTEFIIDLDKGEAETIILSKELKADIVLIDEKLGRRYAKINGLNVIGTLGLLVIAKRMNLINDIDLLMQNMKSKGIWLSDNVMDYVKKLSDS